MNSKLQIRLDLAYPRATLFGVLFIFLSLLLVYSNVSNSNQYKEPLDLAQLLLSIIFGFIGLIPLLSFRVVIISEINKTISIGVDYFFVLKKMETHLLHEFDQIRFGTISRTYSMANNPAPMGVRHSTTTKETDLLFIKKNGEIIFDLKNINDLTKAKLIVDCIQKIKTAPNKK